MGTSGARLPSTLVCVALALIAFARGAAAEPSSTARVGMDLRWAAPASCPQQAEVRERLVQQLRNPPPPDAMALVVITATKEDFELVLKTRSRGAVGERVLRHPNCGELVSAAIAMVAWTFDADSVEEEPSEHDSLMFEREHQAQPPSPPPMFALGAMGAVSTGAFGLVTPGVGVSGRLMGPNFSGRLALAHWFQQTQTAPDGASEGRVALWTSTLNGCWRAGAKAPWDVCLLVEGGIVQARGAGPLEPARRVTAPRWATGIAGTWLLIRDTHFHVPLEVAGLLPLHQSRFVFESSNLNTRPDALFRTHLELRVSLGIELQ